MEGVLSALTTTSHPTQTPLGSQVPSSPVFLEDSLGRGPKSDGGEALPAALPDPRGKQGLWTGKWGYSCPTWPGTLPNVLLPRVEMVRDRLIIFLPLMGCLLYDVGT